MFSVVHHELIAALLLECSRSLDPVLTVLSKRKVLSLGLSPESKSLCLPFYFRNLRNHKYFWKRLKQSEMCRDNLTFDSVQ